MSSKKKYEYRESKNYNRNNKGLKQKRLKDETRWKFNPNEHQSNFEMYDDDFEEEYYDEDRTK